MNTDSIEVTQQEEGVFNSMSEQVGWDGEGLPPVGALCLVNRDPFTYRVMYSSEYVVIVQNLANDNTTAHGMDIILDMRKGDYTFRKPETEAEKLERERNEEIDKMALIVEMKHGFAGDAYRKYCASLYDAGYRKEFK